MSNTLIILSKCQRLIKVVKKNQKFFQFHFRGIYQGEKVKEIRIRDEENSEFEVGSEYLLWAKKLKMEKGILHVEKIKVKKV